MAYIELIDNTKRYRTGETEVLANDHVSFQIEQGDLAIVLGSSGGR